MYSEDDINSAVAAGALSEDAAASFRAHMTQVRGISRGDEENFKLLNSFNDIFVAIGIAIMLARSAVGQAPPAPATLWHMAQLVRNSWAPLAALPSVRRALPVRVTASVPISVTPSSAAMTMFESVTSGMVERSIRRRLIDDDFIDSLEDRSLEDPHVAWLHGLLQDQSDLPVNG